MEWAKRVRIGYLDQHTVLEKGMTIRDVLKSAFAFLFELEEQMNAICDHLGDAPEDEMNAMMEELGTIQDLLMNHDSIRLMRRWRKSGAPWALLTLDLTRMSRI